MNNNQTLKFFYILIVVLHIANFLFAQNNSDAEKKFYNFKEPEFFRGEKGFVEYQHDNTHLKPSNYRLQVQGICKFIFKLGIDGQIKNIVMVDSTTSEYFNKQIRDNIADSRKRWTPANLNGHPVEISIWAFAGLGTIEFGSPNLYYSISAGYNYIVDKTFINNYYNEGVNLSGQNKFTDAILYFDEVLKIASTDIDALYNRGVCKYKSGDKEGSCKDWQHIHELGRNDADALVSKYCNK